MLLFIPLSVTWLHLSQDIFDMTYKQRDIVEVNFLFPDGQTKVHPAIIVSNDTLQEDEEGLI